MGEFTLDTSGVVHIRTEPHGDWRGIGWSDLDAFTQGYVEALFASRWDCPRCAASKFTCDTHFRLGFADLAPEALALILDDCAVVQAKWPEWSARDMAGQDFWRERQDTRLGSDGQWGVYGLPPLTPTLGDDGKVYLQAEERRMEARHG